MSTPQICSECGGSYVLWLSSSKTVCTPCRKSYDQKRRGVLEREAYKKYTHSEGCKCCGYNHPDALELHHLCKNTKKSWESGRTQSRFYNMIHAKEGIAIYLCANCHMLFHMAFGGKQATFPDQTIESTLEIINKNRERY